MLNNHAAYKYEIPYMIPFVITQYWTNVMVTLQCGAIQIWHNIRLIIPYKSGTNIEYINPENMYDGVNI